MVRIMSMGVYFIGRIHEKLVMYLDSSSIRFANTIGGEMDVDLYIFRQEEKYEFGNVVKNR